ncbi:MAG: hypothetical protein PHU33_18160 [Bacteroidales bacterium]|nr:hypothetical protein [Bacteroidales bacterium]
MNINPIAPLKFHFHPDHLQFNSLADFGGQLAARQNRGNALPMRPLGWLSPVEFLHRTVVQDVRQTYKFHFYRWRWDIVRWIEMLYKKLQFPRLGKASTSVQPAHHRIF